MVTFQDICISYKKNPKNYPVYTYFLTLQEQKTLQSTFGNKVFYRLFGGIEAAERKRAVLFVDQEIPMLAIKIDHDKRHLSLTHQNILGTLLSLHIERSHIGDIYPEIGVFIITKEVYPLIKREFTSIGHHKIQLHELPFREVHHVQQYSHHVIYVDSLRLDLVVSRIAKLSRLKASEYIQQELVQRNFEIITKETTILEVGDILSLRKVGRFRLEDASSTSKRGKIVLKYVKYE